MKKHVYTLFLLVTMISAAFFAMFCANENNCSNIYAQSAFASAQAEQPEKTKNAFNILRQSNENGEILLAYVFPVNSKELLEKGFSAAQIATYKFYLSSYVAALANQQKNKQVQGVQVSAVAYFSDLDGLGFSMLFENADAQNRFFDSSNSSQNNNGQGNGTDKENGADKNSVQVRTSGFFVKKVEYQTNFPVASKQAAENFMSVCTLATSAWCSAANLNKTLALSVFDNSVFVYDTASASDGLKSATFHKVGGLYHNVFTKSLAQIEADPTITFYATYPNTAIWYLSALLLTLTAMTIGYFVMKQKINKKNNKITN